MTGASEAPLPGAGRRASSAQLRKALLDLQGRLRLLFDHAPVGFLWIDAQGRVSDCNAAALALLGTERGAILGRDTGQLAECDLTPALEAALAGEHVATVVRWEPKVGADGVRLRCSAARLPGAEGEVLCTLWQVGERRASRRRRGQATATNGTTGLPTSTALRSELEAALERASASKGALLVALLGLDRFGAVNEALGHSIADQLLRAVAERLQGVVRRGDLVARWQSDQFMVLWEGLEGEADAVAAAERLQGCFRESFSAEAEEVSLTASIGLAVYPSDGADPDELIASAESALLEAERAGHDRYRFFTPAMRTARTERHSLERALRGALERGELSLHYQPEVRTRDCAAVGYEALLRWQHPERGMVAPDEFIPVAEESGLIVEIGTWVLRRACAEAAVWQRPGGPPLRVGVNLSARQLHEAGLAGTVRAALEENGLAGTQLELEVTETALMVEPARAATALAELRELGVRIALDDFGTGYSSLAHLRELPITSLKIDRSFISSLPAESDGLAITRAVIELAKNLGVEAIAEGVETAAQLETIRALGCREAQGFLFSRPLPADRLLSRQVRYLPRQQPATRTAATNDASAAPGGEPEPRV